MATLEDHLQECKFDKYFKKLIKKLKGKSVIVYGTGTMFQLIQENYDLSEINIIGVSDSKYLLEEEGKKDLGYTIIPKEHLGNYDADVVLLGLKIYYKVLVEFSENLYKGKKTKVLPLVRIPFLKSLKDILFN